MLQSHVTCVNQSKSFDIAFKTVSTEIGDNYILPRERMPSFLEVFFEVVELGVEVVESRGDLA